MSNPKSSRTRRLFRLFLVVVALFLTGKLIEPSFWKYRLARAVAEADSIVLDPNVIPEQIRVNNKWPLCPTCEIKGREAVDAFLNAVKFRSEFIPCGCLCYGQLLLHFRSKDRTEQTVRWYEEPRLESPVYWSSGSLTTESRAAVKQWLVNWGGKVWADTRAEADRLWARWLRENSEGQIATGQPASDQATQPATGGGD